MRSRARYELEQGDDGIPAVKIINLCTQKEEKESRAIGESKVKGDRELVVKFSIFMNLFNRVNYEIIFLDTNYQVAVAGSPDKEYLRVLSSQILLRAEVDRLLQIAQNLALILKM